MASLYIRPNVARADDIYAALIGIHEGRDETESMRINARLILLLINHIGDAEAVLEAIQTAGRLSPPASG